MTKAKTLYFLAVSVTALVTAQGALAQNASGQGASGPTAQELTRALNSRPPQAATAPAPVTRPAPAVAAQNPAVRPASGTRPETAAPAARPATQTQAPAVVPAARITPATSAPVERPVAPAQTRTQTPVQTQVPAPTPAPVAPARTATAAPRIMPMNSAAIAALPFRIDLKGAQIVERPAGPSAKVYSVRRGETPLLMIYTGPQSDYPIYGGDQAEVAGRTSIIVAEGMRRRAVEHLFRREDAQPADIHVWVMAMDGADGDLAEQIAQTVDPR